MANGWYVTEKDNLGRAREESREEPNTEPEAVHSGEVQRKAEGDTVVARHEGE